MKCKTEKKAIGHKKRKWFHAQERATDNAGCSAIYSLSEEDLWDWEKYFLCVSLTPFLLSFIYAKKDTPTNL